MDPRRTSRVWLAGLGYEPGEYPVVRTPSGGSHIYVNFAGGMMDSSKKLALGAGEFRYGSGAEVAAYPSVIAEGVYRLVSGDIAHPATLDLNDVRTLVNINEAQVSNTDRRISRLALAMLKGNMPSRYKSASEAEAGLILSLINGGYDLEGIRMLFENNPCLGHYQNRYKNSKDRSAYLYRTYNEMLAHSKHVSPARRKIEELIELANNAAWKNINQKRVFLAHLAIAHKAAKFEYAASVRDIALGAGVGITAAYRQTQNILRDKLLTEKERGTIVSATVYSLPEVDKEKHFLSTPNVRKCSSLSTWNNEPVSSHDAFRNGGGRYAKDRLGRRAGEVYELIFNNPLSVSKIAEQTGASKKTVKRALRRMETFIDYRTGEVIGIVSREDGKWVGNLVDLDTVAAMTRTLGATGKQKMDYEKDRREHARMLELGTLKERA